MQALTATLAALTQLGICLLGISDDLSPPHLGRNFSWLRRNYFRLQVACYFVRGGSVLQRLLVVGSYFDDRIASVRGGVVERQGGLQIPQGEVMVGDQAQAQRNVAKIERVITHAGRQATPDL